MRTTSSLLVVAGAVLLAGCGGGGRPGAGDVLSRLNAAGVSCEVQPGFTAGPVRAASSCVTPEGRQVAVLTFDDDDEQESFLEGSPTALAGTPFTALVYDYGYVLAVADPDLAALVTTRMDAQRLAVPTARLCPTARDGACPAGGTANPFELGSVPSATSSPTS